MDGDNVRQRYCALVDMANNSKTRSEHYEWKLRLNGFLDGVTAFGGNTGHLIMHGDEVQMSRGVDRPMCGGLWLDWEPQADIDNSNFAAEEAGGLEQRRDPEIFHRHANGRRDIQTHERSPGKCPHCGSKDLWDDNLAYGCRSCKAILGGN